MLSLLKPSFVFLVETWLSDSTPNSILGLDNYIIYRKDRKSTGGGVLAAVSKSIISVEVATPVTLEMLAIDIYTRTTPLFRFLVVYIPHISDRDYVSYLCLSLNELTNVTYPFVIVCDLNCPDMNWNKFHSDIASATPLTKFLLEKQPLTHTNTVPLC